MEASKDEIPPRVGGVMMLVGGLVFGYFFVYSPLRQIQQGAASVSLHLSAAGITPLTLGFGLFYAILGERAVPILGSLQKPNRLGWIVGGILALAGLGLYFWLRQSLVAHGYVR